jgi:S1-C subfamily serine protease
MKPTIAPESKFMSSSSNTESNLFALSQNLAEIVDRVGPSIVGVNARRFSSSGIHWRSGIIVTSDETIRREEDITVTLSDNRTVPVTLVGRDPSTDVAVLKLTDAELPVAEIGDANSLKVGHLVMAIGRGRERGLSASLGVVSTAGGAWRSMLGGGIDRFLRLDLNLYPTSIGGAIVDATGRVVGFSTSGPRGTVLTIPTSTVNRVLDQLVQKGRISRGYLGVGMQSVSLQDALKNKLSISSAYGVMVVSVEAQSPADKGGILLGDILIALNDTSVQDTRDVQAFLASQVVGQTIAVKTIRGGELVELSIVVGEK